MRGWRDRRGAGVEIRQTARAIRAQNVRPHARGEGATAGATARASWVRVYQRGLWGLGRASRRALGLGLPCVGLALGGDLGRAFRRASGAGFRALGRLGDSRALGRFRRDLGRTGFRGRGFPALGFTGAGFTGVASGAGFLPGAGLPAGFRRASRGLSGAGFRGLSGAGFPGASRGLSRGLPPRRGASGAGFRRASGGLSRRAFPAGAGRWRTVFPRTPRPVRARQNAAAFFCAAARVILGFRLSRRWLRRRAASRRARWP